jgi:hypothetical protein
MVGHHGERITRMVIGKRFYWPKMKQDVEHFVRTSVKCQSTKSIYKKKYELYRLYQSGTNHGELCPWTLGPNYPNGMDVILVVVD